MMKQLEICGMPQWNVTTWVDGVKRCHQVGCSDPVELRKSMVDTADRVRIDPVMVGEGWG